MMRPSNSGDGDLGCDVERPTSRRRCRAHCDREAGQAETLEDGDVERGQMGDVPGVVTATPADAVAGVDPPAASTVVTNASAVPSNSQ